MPPLHLLPRTSLRRPPPLLLLRRFLSTTPPPHPLASGQINLTAHAHRALISLHGPDSTRFLQAITTANIDKLLSPTTTTTRSSYTAFLTPQGRILHEGFVYNLNHSPHWRSQSSSSGGGGGKQQWDVDDPAWMIETSNAGAVELARWLGKYKLRSKLTITTPPSSEDGGWDIWVRWGEAADGGDIDPALDLDPTTTPLVNDTRAPGLFTRFILPRPTPTSTSTSTPPPSTSTTPLEAYHLRRFLYGVAEGPLEIPTGKALPHEYNMDLSGEGLDFRKGCYVGQEMTTRTEHRGVVRKRVVGVQLGGGDYEGLVYDSTAFNGGSIPADAEIVATHTPAEGEAATTTTTGGSRATRHRSAGKYLAGMGNVGLALVRLETMFPPGWGGVGATEEGRWGAGNFKVVWGEKGGEREVAVRAWMPGWHFRSLAEEEGGIGG